MMKMDRRLIGETEHLTTNGICLTEKLERSLKNCQNEFWGTISSVEPAVLPWGQANPPCLFFLLAAHRGFLLSFVFFLSGCHHSFHPLDFPRLILQRNIALRSLLHWKATTQALHTANVLLPITPIFFTNKDLGHHSFYCFHSAQYQFPYQLSITTIMLGDNHQKLSDYSNTFI